MALADRYRCFKEEGWRFAVCPDRWSEELQRRVLALVESQSFSKHPQTLKLHDPEPNGCPLYLKVFHGPRGIAALKDLFRRSKALRFLRQSLALEEAGFGVPKIIAAGEVRRSGLLLRAFTVTAEVPGRPIPEFLRHWVSANSNRAAFAHKREAIRLLAEQLQRFHRLGFVHGDLVPSNILLADADGIPAGFSFMDNDRTHCYPRLLPQPLWKRNLVQLNRFPLPGISLQDRMRFFRWYLGRRRFGAAERRLLHWLEIKTRQRRKECDSVDASVDFRRLMSWREETAAGG